jgi:hypothetical protein
MIVALISERPKEAVVVVLRHYQAYCQLELETEFRSAGTLLKSETRIYRQKKRKKR